MDSTVWKYDEENKTVKYEVDDEYFHSDVLPALRYGWEYLHQFKGR
jgi:hypothetical protein